MNFPVRIQTEELDDTWPNGEAVFEVLSQRVRKAYAMKAEGEDPEGLPGLERYIVLSTIDHHWQEFLRNIDSLREGIGLMGIGQRDPLVEFKREAYGMFQDLMGLINAEVAQKAFRMHTSQEAMAKFASVLSKVSAVHQDVQALAAPTQATNMARGGGEAEAESAVDEALEAVERKPVRREFPKVGRNDPCPCGSRKKYKKCHGVAGA